MRILVIADTHGAFSGADYEALGELDFDACVSLGDVDRESLAFWERRCREAGVPMYALVGNHDTWGWLEGFDYLVDVHNRAFELGGHSCLGFGGSYDYADSSAEDKRTVPVMDDAESLALADAPAAEILFTHDSAKIERLVDPAYLARVMTQIPHATNHPGLLGITRYIERHSPRLAISGHHHANLQLRCGDTTCIGVYGLAVVDVDTGEAESLLVGDGAAPEILEAVRL